MAIPHAKPGEVIAIDSDSGGGTRTLFKTAHVEVIRMVLPQGKTIPQHRAAGEIVVQCLAGRVTFAAAGQTIELQRGQMFYLAAGEPHDVHAVEDCQFLLTILLSGKG